MKSLDNHLYILISHVITLLGIQIICFSVISLICIAITFFFLCLNKFLRKKHLINYLIQLVLFSLIPFCYSTEELMSLIKIHPVSIINAVLLVIVFFIAINITKTRRESYINVRNKYTDDKTVLKKANCFASRCLYFIMVPLFLLIFYFDWYLKIIFTLAIILGTITAIYIYSIIIYRKEEILRQKEAN